MEDISIDRHTIDGGARMYQIWLYDTESVPTVLVIDGAVPRTPCRGRAAATGNNSARSRL